MDRIYSEWVQDSLQWMPERGMGYYPVRGNSYDESYFQKYRGYADTDIGRAITKARCDMVSRHYYGPLLDVGIGSGQFVDARPDTYGYDVNHVGVEWLKSKGRYMDLYAEPVHAATFWDSLEHIQHPHLSIDQVRRWVFVSIPIFKDAYHVLYSRHYRKDEHYWYFTFEGLVNWMEQQRFVMREYNSMETDLGREGIMSFAFERRGP